MRLIPSCFELELWWLDTYVPVKTTEKFFQLFQILWRLLILLAREFQMG